MASAQHVQPLHQGGAIGQAGEPIEMRKAMNLVGSTLTLSDVLLELNVVTHTAIGLTNGSDHHSLGDFNPILAVVDLLTGPVLAPRQCVAQPLELGGRQAIARDPVRQLAHGFVAGVTHAGQKRSVDVLNAPIQVGDDDALGALLHDKLQLAQFSIRSGQVDCNEPRLLHAAQITAARQQRCCSSHCEYSTQVGHIREPVAVVGRGQPVVEVGPHKKQEKHARGPGEHQCRPGTKNPPRKHDQHGIVDQVGPPQATIVGGHHGDHRPYAPDQHQGRVVPALPAPEQHGQATHRASAQVEQHLRPRKRLV